jgi:hypothetical protein
MTNFLGALPYFIGANPRAISMPSAYGNPMTGSAMMRANRAAGFVRPDMAGVPSRDAALLPMAFPAFTFALATGTNIITQSANPQTPFRGQRVSAVIVRNGTSAATTAPVVQQFLVGQKPIITTGNGVPLETFNQNAFDTNLLLPPTIPGVNYVMNVNLIAALTTTDTLLALVTIIGSALL